MAPPAPAGGFMGQDDRRYVMNSMLAAVSGGVPYHEDYYFQVRPCHSVCNAQRVCVCIHACVHVRDLLCCLWSAISLPFKPMQQRGPVTPTDSGGASGS